MTALMRPALFIIMLAGFAVALAQPSPALLYEHVRPYLGVPYLWGGTDPGRGLDCSGFVQLVYQELGVQLPRTSREQFAAFPPVRERLLPGDLLYFAEDGRRITHVALYLGDGYIAHAAQSRGKVTIEPARNLAAIYVGANRPWAVSPSYATPAPVATTT